MSQVTIKPLVPGLKPVVISTSTPGALSDVIRTYQANGIPYRLHYDTSTQRNHLAPSFVSR